MTVMKNKSAEEKRNRWTRYERAVKPVMEKFGCTSMEVAGIVGQTLRENTSLKAQLEEREAQGREDATKIAAMKEQIDRLKMDAASLRYELRTAQSKFTAESTDS